MAAEKVVEEIRRDGDSTRSRKDEPRDRRGDEKRSPGRHRDRHQRIKADRVASSGSESSGGGGGGGRSRKQRTRHARDSDDDGGGDKHHHGRSSDARRRVGGDREGLRQTDNGGADELRRRNGHDETRRSTRDRHSHRRRRGDSSSEERTGDDGHHRDRKRMRSPIRAGSKGSDEDDDHHQRRRHSSATGRDGRRGQLNEAVVDSRAHEGGRASAAVDGGGGGTNNTAAALTRSGGVYIPPFKLARMMKEIEDKSSDAYQRLTWDALRKSINGLVNKVNATNIKNIIPELFSENLIRARGLFCRSCMKSQMASPGFTDVFAALVAVVNTKFPEVGKLLLKRIVLQLRRAYKRNDKPLLLAATKFIAHLVNQQVAHEIVALELLTLLLENPTDDSVEVAVGFVTECGSILQDLSPQGLHGDYSSQPLKVTSLHEFYNVYCSVS
ncbi:hypothetical protein QJS04_geneDACA023952 [Acorus gramineus]|uniref:MIF4G domain-containing protein n=1 Tax=Acorus gramineus TaxID=55184 RepID=A0AAV9B533_ACOGR|nr:hypothetical protein QJS04_geneDACA023952 [Acorus gramineus]